MINWHPVSDCFQKRHMDKVDSLNTIDIPQGTANLIKPAKVPSVDFEAIPIVGEKVKMWPRSSPQMPRKEEHL